MAILSSVGSWKLYPFRAYTATIAVASWAYVEIEYEGDGEVLENVGSYLKAWEQQARGVKEEEKVVDHLSRFQYRHVLCSKEKVVEKEVIACKSWETELLEVVELQDCRESRALERVGLKGVVEWESQTMGRGGVWPEAKKKD